MEALSDARTRRLLLLVALLPCACTTTRSEPGDGDVADGADAGDGGSDADAPAVAVGWALRFGGAEDDEGVSVALDEDGNVYVAGSFEGSFDLGGTALASAGRQDILVASFDSAGGFRWARGFGDTGVDSAAALAVDSSGTVWVTGEFRGTVDFGGGPLRSPGGPNAFVARFDQDGGHLWSADYGGMITDEGRGIAADGAGNVYVTGMFMGRVDFGAGDLPWAGQTDVFLASYDSTAALRWARSFGGPEADSVLDVAADPAGDSYIAGRFREPLDFGGGTLTSAGETDVFIASFDPEGNHRWSRRYGGASDDSASAVAVGPSGRPVVVTGSFRESIDFGGGELVASEAIFVAAFDEDGGHLWSTWLEEGSSSRGDDVEVGAEGNAYMVGTSGGDLLVAGFDGSGRELWSRSLLRSGTAAPRAIAATEHGAHVTGAFDRTATVDGALLECAGRHDGFLLQLVPQP